MRECFMVDNDGHWYLIPVEKRNLFNKLLDDGEQDEYVNFIDEFDTFRTIYHITQYSFENSEAIGE